MAATKTRASKQSPSKSKAKSTAKATSKPKGSAAASKTSKRGTAKSTRSSASAARKRKPSSAKSAKSQSSRSRSASSKSASKPKSAGAKRGGGGARAKAQQGSGGGAGVVEKVKGPATTAGAVLLAAAGGLAATRGKKSSGLLSRGRGSKLSLPKPKKSGIGKALRQASLPRPNLKKGLGGVKLPSLDASVFDWVEEKARDVGEAADRVEEMTSQARRAHKAVSGGS